MIQDSSDQTAAFTPASELEQTSLQLAHLMENAWNSTIVPVIQDSSDQTAAFIHASELEQMNHQPALHMGNALV